MLVTFVAYNIYQQEGGNLFSNSHELLLLQALVLVIPHVLARSRGSQMMSAYESKGGKIGSKLNHYLQILT